jgi:lysophospholipase L1-like esterase
MLGLMGGLALCTGLPFGRLQQLLGAEPGLAIALGRARVGAAGRASCVLVGDSRIAALGTWSSACQLVNLGRAGAAAADWRRWLSTLDAGLPADAQVVVWIGVNDLIRHHAPAPRVAEDLIAVLRGLAQGERIVHVLPQLASPGHAAALNAASLEVDARLRRDLSGVANLRFVEPATFGVGTGGPGPDFYLDGLHLGAAANARLRAALEQALRRARSDA